MNTPPWLASLRAAAPSAEVATPAQARPVSALDGFVLRVAVGHLPLAAAWLKGQGYDLLNFMTAVDYIQEHRFELVYHFVKSRQPDEQVFFKVDLARESDPGAPSLTPLYASADWQERETFDLFGIRFEGHPNHRRILLWDGYPGWPLRKDYVHTRDAYDSGAEIGLPAGAR